MRIECDFCHQVKDETYYRYWSTVLCYTCLDFKDEVWHNSFKLWEPNE